MKSRYFTVLVFVAISGLLSCSENVEVSPTDSPTAGTIHVSIDESFKPVMDMQIAQYQRLYPGTKIEVAYKPEASALRDLFGDSATRMIIISRRLTIKEERFLRDSLHYQPPIAKIASDAIALIVNINSTDTLITMDRLRNQLLGKTNRSQNIVFDGLSATGSVRYITDSILKGAAFDTSVVKAAANSQGVIDYVAENKNAIGVIGISWIGNPEDKAQVKMLEKVKLAYVECAECQDEPFVKPMQATIASRRYPLVRSLYYVLKENFNGLGNGFASFLKFEKGQLIFRRAYLRPVMDFDIRNVKVNEELPK